MVDSQCRRFLLAGAAALLLFGAPLAAAQSPGKEKNLAFEAQVVPLDPFAEGNRAGAKFEARRGEPFLLTIRGTPKNGYYTYPLTKSTESQPREQLSTLRVEAPDDSTVVVHLSRPATYFSSIMAMAIPFKYKPTSGRRS